jgi:hypothetical protein
MLPEQIINQDELVKIEKWFHETYPDTSTSSREIQRLILYKLLQLEERLKVVEHQTKTHWLN